MHGQLGAQAGHLEYPIHRISAVRMDDGKADRGLGRPAAAVEDRSENGRVDERGGERSTTVGVP